MFHEASPCEVANEVHTGRRTLGTHFVQLSVAGGQSAGMPAPVVVTESDAPFMFSHAAWAVRNAYGQLLADRLVVTAPLDADPVFDRRDDALLTIATPLIILLTALAAGLAVALAWKVTKRRSSKTVPPQPSVQAEPGSPRSRA